MTTRKMLLGMLGVMVIGVVACTGDRLTDPTPETNVLTSVVPAGGSSDVDPAQPVVIGFDHAMMEGMEQYARLHLGGVDGPAVDGTWRWSDSRMALTFSSERPLQRATRYTLHLGGRILGMDGGRVDVKRHGQAHMGGQWAAAGMMGGEMGAGMMGGSGAEHMGEGWRHPTNGSYGMIFVFTTAR